MAKKQLVWKGQTVVYSGRLIVKFKENAVSPHQHVRALLKTFPELSLSRIKHKSRHCLFTSNDTENLQDLIARISQLETISWVQPDFLMTLGGRS